MVQFLGRFFGGGSGSIQKTRLAKKAEKKIGLNIELFCWPWIFVLTRLVGYVVKFVGVEAMVGFETCL